MKKSEFDIQPDLVVNEGNQVRISFDAEQVEKQVEPMGGGEPTVRQIWEAYVVRLNEPLTRSRIIDAIVTAQYPSDVMQAVQNNYLANPKDTEAKAEMDAMQQWRTHAKQVADEVQWQKVDANGNEVSDDEEDITQGNDGPTPDPNEGGENEE